MPPIVFIQQTLIVFLVSAHTQYFVLYCGVQGLVSLLKYANHPEAMLHKKTFPKMKLTRLGHPKLLHFFLKIHFIIVALQCLVSSVHQSESAIHTSSLSWISFPFRSPQSTE